MVSWEAAERGDKIVQGYMSDSEVIVVDRLAWHTLIGSDQVMWMCMSGRECSRLLCGLLGRFFFLLVLSSLRRFTRLREINSDGLCKAKKVCR